MPIYEYQCECGSKYDIIHSINDNQLQQCKDCDCIMTRLISAPAGYVKGTENPVKNK